MAASLRALGPQVPEPHGVVAPGRHQLHARGELQGREGGAVAGRQTVTQFSGRHVPQADVAVFTPGGAGLPVRAEGHATDCAVVPAVQHTKRGRPEPVQVPHPGRAVGRAGHAPVDRRARRRASDRPKRRRVPHDTPFLAGAAPPETKAAVVAHRYNPGNFGIVTYGHAGHFLQVPQERLFGMSDCSGSTMAVMPLWRRGRHSISTSPSTRSRDRSWIEKTASWALTASPRFLWIVLITPGIVANFVHLQQGAGLAQFQLGEGNGFAFAGRLIVITIPGQLRSAQVFLGGGALAGGVEPLRGVVAVPGLVARSRRPPARPC